MDIRDYEELRDRGWNTVIEGGYEAGLKDLERACEVAELLVEDHPELRDGAAVNLALARTQAHQDEQAERGLREVLLRTSDRDVIRVATHALAKILSRRNQHDRALRYALTSLEMAQEDGGAQKIVSGHTQLGMVYLNQSYLDKSLASYQMALETVEQSEFDSEDVRSHSLVVTSDNVGYVLVLLGQLDEGKAHLQRAHEGAKQLGFTDLIAETGTDLCFAHLQADELAEARAHGQAALAIAEEHDYEFFRRNCYYLLGEVASRLGEDAEADAHFSKLAEFYPQIAFLGDFLKEYDISGMINLKEFA